MCKIPRPESKKGIEQSPGNIFCFVLSEPDHRVRCATHELSSTEGPAKKVYTSMIHATLKVHRFSFKASGMRVSTSY